MKKITTHHNPAISRVLKHFGSIQAVADALGISRTAISCWTDVPAHHVSELEKHTGIPRWQLRPDLFDEPGYDR